MCLKFTALEVGSGDAFLLEDGDKKILFDSGGSKNKIVALLKKKGINKIDLAICSHNDVDHANGFIGLLNSSISIKEIWLPGTWASIIRSAARFINHGCHLCDNGICCIEDFYFWIHHSKNDMDEIDSFYDELLSFPKEEFSNGQLIEDLHYINSIMASDYESCCKCLEIDRERCYFRECLHDVSDCELSRMRETSTKLKIKFDRIIKIAELAYKSCGNVRWFEPANSCTKTRIDNNFIMLNANEIAYVRKFDDPLMLMFALSLTVENEYSLILEYLHNDIPVVRFSADSNLSCQSQYSYSNSIIVTAPHHGSAANDNVYTDLKGNDIIWVRSDAIKKTQGRPCQMFKKQNNKYCLSCVHRKPVISELCFVYDSNNKKWIHQHGVSCGCKP